MRRARLLVPWKDLDADLTNEYDHYGRRGASPP